MGVENTHGKVFGVDRTSGQQLTLQWFRESTKQVLCTVVTSENLSNVKNNKPVMLPASGCIANSFLELSRHQGASPSCSLICNFLLTYLLDDTLLKCCLLTVLSPGPRPLMRRNG